jgi:hypothetical protein
VNAPRAVAHPIAGSHDRAIASIVSAEPRSRCRRSRARDASPTWIARATAGDRLAIACDAYGDRRVWRSPRAVADRRAQGDADPGQIAGVFEAIVSILKSAI